MYRYIDRIAMVSSGGHNFTPASQEVMEWMNKIQEWNPKYFTLSHIPVKYRTFVSKFLRRVIIARMAESPDLASAYHRKLREAYETEEKLRDAEVVSRSEEHLARLLDEVESKLSESTYLTGDEFSLADVMLIPVLARLSLLDLEETYIISRPNIAEYWFMVKQRPSYKKVIGRYFDGWRRQNMLIKTWCYLRVRTMLRRY
ncbi:OLC1v1016430C2 [Oldenlandia corymbosa var. corymbosa]|uniref:OLC1v1016430C2 n=1 Tax=Oldenlandia corymbosa var. corymbosa TaxID=529605 RepID=A0AAV1E608_OLDCO|nr:OLC1v1016430C2 [Oldenlandia corymbosa var. corymbosa]